MIADPRILVSASDAAAADVMIVVAGALRNAQLEHRIVAGEPAYTRMRSAGVDAHFFPHPRAGKSQMTSHRTLISAANEIIEDYRPDAILVGLSGPDVGIDEALVAASQGKVPSYAVQDFWGDVNESLSARPRVYFVVDEFASEITRRRTQAGVEVVGSVRYAGYDGLDVVGIRRAARAGLGVDDDVVVVGLFTQPLWHVDGYARQFEMLIESLRSLSRRCVLGIRRHPRDSAESVELLERHASRNRVPTVDMSALTIEAALSACDAVVSAFSSVATDVCYLQRAADGPLGVPLLLLLEPGVQSLFERQCGFDTHPLVQSGLAMEVRDAGDLPPIWSRVTDPETRRQIWLRCGALPDSQCSADRIIKRLCNDWRGVAR